VRNAVSGCAWSRRGARGGCAVRGAARWWRRRRDCRRTPWKCRRRCSWKRPRGCRRARWKCPWRGGAGGGGAGRGGGRGGEAPAQGHRPRRERSPEAPPVPERGRRMTVSAVCVAVSAVWLAVLALTNARNTSGGLVVTAGLIGVNLVVSLYVLFSRNHILL